jgi:uncharacterized RDD family membrane protein YckC
MLMPNEIPGMGRRLLAVILDLLLLSLATTPLAPRLREITPEPAAILVLNFVLALLYSTFLLTARGQTIGKMVAGLKVIGTDGGSVTQVQAFLRSLLKWTPIFGMLILQAGLAPLPTVPSGTVPKPPGLPQPADIEPATALASSAVSVLGLSVLLLLFVLTKRHPDRRAPHDRAVHTLVMRLP